MGRGRPRKRPAATQIVAAPVKVLKSPSDLVSLMARYHEASGGKNRGMFEDLKADIYRLWLLDYNDWRLGEIRATGTSDRVYHEWLRKFERAFGSV